MKISINSKVYLIGSAKMFGYNIPNSVQVIPGLVKEITGNGNVTVEIEMENNKTQFQTISITEVYENIHIALQNLEPFLNNKVKFISEESYTGEEIPHAI